MIPWLTQDRTRDGTRSRFAGRARYPLKNTDGRHGEPGREDYAVQMRHAVEGDTPGVWAPDPDRETGVPWMAEGVTRDAYRSRFAGRAKFAADNADGRYNEPGRQDYCAVLEGGEDEGEPLTHESLEGSATLYGITELADVSDPPRKYLQLVPNCRAIRRDINSPFSRFGFSAINRTAYDTSGTRTHQTQAWANISSGTPYGSGGGLSLNSPGDSLESANFTPLSGTQWDTPPIWTKERLRKYINCASFSTPTVDACREEFGQGFGRLGGVVTTIRGVGVSAVWSGTYWTLTILVYNDDSSSSRQLYMTLRNGNRDPGTPSAASYLVGTTATQYATHTILVPPDCSMRFMTRITGNATSDVQVPQQIGTTISNGSETASGLTVDAYDRWLYFAASDVAMPTWRIEESLCAEDTLEAGIARAGGGTSGTEAVATTTAVGGGSAAESNVPLTWAGRIVTTSQLQTGLTTGNRYGVEVLVRDNTIGLTDYTFTLEESDEFVAAASAEVVSHRVLAPLGKERIAVAFTLTDQGVDPPEPPEATDYDIAVLLWQGNVLAAGGTVDAASLAIADALVLALKAASLWDKIVYLPVLLGSNLAAALVPLRDSAGAGNMTNTNFVEADFSEATGLQGDGTTKRLTIPRRPDQLGTSGNGGMFWWELAFTGTGNVEPIGAYNNAGTRRFCLDLRATLRAFRWGNPTPDSAVESVSADNAFYHGERRSSTDRELYRNGVSLASDTGADSTSGINENNIIACGCDEGAGFFPWPGRAGCFGLTDGTLTDADALALYEILRDELMTPTGRI